MKLSQGIHDAVPMPDYIADPCEQPSISTGVIKDLYYRSERHAYTNHPRLGGGRDDKSSRAEIGTMAHQLVLGGIEKLAVLPAEFENYKKKAAQDARDKAREAGKIPMLAKDFAAVNAMVAPAREALERYPGKPEQTLIWEEDGVWFRSRPDWICDVDYVIDYKTTNNADPSTWARTTLIPGGYDIQAALVLRGLERITGKTWDALWLPHEIKPPHAYSYVGMSPEMREDADRKINVAIAKWKWSLKNDAWPSYSQTIHYANPPGYAKWDIEEREAREVA